MDITSGLNLPGSQFKSDSYHAALSMARDAIGNLNGAHANLHSIAGLSSTLARHLTDSAESLSDDRRICRKAVIDAMRARLREEIEHVMRGLDEVRRSDAALRGDIDTALLNEATGEALKARLALAEQGFRVTLRHLEMARSGLNTILASASRSAA